MRMIACLLLAACSPDVSWAPAVAATTPGQPGKPIIADRPALYLGAMPETPHHEIGRVEVRQSLLDNATWKDLLDGLRGEAQKRGCDAVQVDLRDWIPDEIPDDGRAGVFVSLGPRHALRVEGLRAVCFKLDG